MTKERIRGYCPRCGHEQLFTLGLWVVSWVAISIGNQIRPWRCQQCGWYKPLTRPRDSGPPSSDDHAER